MQRRPLCDLCDSELFSLTVNALIDLGSKDNQLEQDISGSNNVMHLIDDITEKRGTKRKAETQEVTHTPSGTPSGTCSGTPQIEWESIWEMYTAAADTHVENGTENCVSDSIYDLVSSVVKDGVGYACIDPTVAMVKAKSYWSTLPLEQQNQQLKGKWKWSPQSTKTSELLVEVYGNLDAAYTVGWRWYPEPVRITRDTHISQMPDLSLRLL